MSERIELIRHEDGVTEVHLTREDKMNAVDPQMLQALISTGEQLRADTSLRAVVITGRGRAFSAGFDFVSFERMRDSADAPPDADLRDIVARTHGIANAPQQACLVWRQIPVPVIAAVHGVAFGAGLQLALGADIRLVTADAQLSIMEFKWGLVPDMTGVARLRNLVRDDVARELTYTGRIVSGTEAAALGLATRVVTDPLAEALTLAHQIATKNPDAIRGGKRLMNAAADSLQGEAELLLAEAREQQALIGTANQAEAVRANMEKRAPVFV